MWTGQEAPGDAWHSLGGSRDAGKDHFDSRETPGRDHQQPVRHQGGTREAGKDHLDSQ